MLEILIKMQVVCNKPCLSFISLLFFITLMITKMQMAFLSELGEDG